jgi:hypothetical protein
MRTCKIVANLNHPMDADWGENIRLNRQHWVYRDENAVVCQVDNIKEKIEFSVAVFNSFYNNRDIAHSFNNDIIPEINKDLRYWCKGNSIQNAVQVLPIEGANVRWD